MGVRIQVHRLRVPVPVLLPALVLVPVPVLVLVLPAQTLHAFTTLTRMTDEPRRGWRLAPVVRWQEQALDCGTPTFCQVRCGALGVGGCM